tara:strand:- start:1728 stop:1889 length:162 start_codon:yes stop_codon:yes gene_type:complete
MCPSDWTNEKALKFINIDCPEVTLDRLIAERHGLGALDYEFGAGEAFLEECDL